ncbi:tRNA 2-thiouridine(34) synthase MnmA [Desulfobulbus sp.]|uniref:tRNA 2-thiouridine(34) synthase MnmA n=1 Tax=Desulfobulbus sp. TaxID=895 RepID=UPI00286EF3B9|nr:tRNA 2-thiouridine(34) synthase MnmA [Desulfobulbus sp.]
MVRLKIGVAMSGGVDSTMAASLVREQGHEVHGFFMLLPLPDLDAQLARVRQVAGQLAIPLTLIDLRRHFTAEVVGYFTATYQAGLTPNPCIHCNHAIKFGLLAEAIRSHGMDRIATGHYARIGRRHGRRFVARGIDRQKDQSYFLARLDAEQVERIFFPVGAWTKEHMYERAAGLGFRFEDQESQDVCFLAAGLPAFLNAQGIGDQAGPMVNRDGRRLGEHRGVWQYTIGQRRGLGLPDATPWYVVGLDGAANRVIVGKHDELFADRCTVHSLRWTHEPPELPWRGLVQLRSRHQPAPAELTAAGVDTWQLAFANPQRAIAPGQFAVFYEDDLVLGSAVIAAETEAERAR